jgi:predicted DNA-binding transcriptional regulator YafY
MKKETSKIERILKLILFLDVSFPRKKEECIDFLQITDSTFYEYIKLLRYSGFEVKQKDGSYWIDILNTENSVLTQLLHFNEEEAYLLSKAIKQLDVSLPVAARLYQKLIKLVDGDQLLTSVVKKQESEIIKNLEKAITEKKQILLLNYASGNSLTIKDRLVEPFEFKHQFNLLWAYDVQEQACRQFKISRIENTELTSLNWEHAHEHQCLPIDLFRNTGALIYPVQFNMTLRAFNLLIEEYPLAEKQCHKRPSGKYHFDANIAKQEGAARFVLGLAEDIEVIGNHQFINFLKEKSKIIQNKLLTPENPESQLLKL